MGVDCKVILPHNARIEDVADVMGALAGLTPTRRDFGKPSDGWSCHVDGVECKSTHTPAMATIHLTAGDGKKLVDGKENHFCFYHFEDRNGRLVSMRSTDFWISIAKGLVDFFGGAADFNDCDSSECDYYRFEQPDIHAEDGEEWYHLQQRKLDVKPISKQELHDSRKVAAYS